MCIGINAARPFLNQKLLCTRPILRWSPAKRGYAVKAEPQSMFIKDLVDLYKEKMLVANPEYQRGVYGALRLRKN
jgi:hypothetical protein